MNKFNRSSFSSDFDKRHNRLTNIVWGVFGVVFVLIVIQWAVVGYIGVKAIDEVNENNGSIAKSLGSFYKEFKEASE